MIIQLWDVIRHNMGPSKRSCHSTNPYLTTTSHNCLLTPKQELRLETFKEQSLVLSLSKRKVKTKNKKKQHGMMLSQSLGNTEATAGEAGTLTAAWTDRWPSWRSSASTWITDTWRGWFGGWRLGSWRRVTTTTWPSATRWRVRTKLRHPAGLCIHSLIAQRGHRQVSEAPSASLVKIESGTGMRDTFLRVLWCKFDRQAEGLSLSVWPLGWIYDVALG